MVSFLHLIPKFAVGLYSSCLRHFPKARVWPPLPQSEYNPPLRREESISLPDSATQEELLEIYFAYVHPALPLLHKQSFLEEIRCGCDVLDSFRACDILSSSS
jgi:hypothetical protein